jgi:hypothetical protein
MVVCSVGNSTTNGSNGNTTRTNNGTEHVQRQHRDIINVVNSNQGNVNNVNLQQPNAQPTNAHHLFTRSTYAVLAEKKLFVAALLGRDDSREAP